MSRASVPTLVRLFGSAFDASGRLLLSGTVPSGLAGLELGLLSFAILADGRVHASAVTRLAFD